MEKVHINGQMVDYTMEITKKIKNMDLAFIYGLMAEHMLGIGSKVNNMMNVFMFCQTVRSGRESGKTVKRRSG